LHAGLSDRQFLLWAEQATEGPSRPRRPHASGATPPHPFAANRTTLREILKSIGPVDPAPRFLDAIASLPTSHDSPVPSSPLIGDAPSDPATLETWSLPACELDMPAAIQLLSVCRDRSDGDGIKALLAPGLVVGPDMGYWAIALHFGMGLVLRQHVLPVLGEDDQGHYASWEPALTGADAERFNRLAAAMPAPCRALGLEAGDTPPPRQSLLKSFLDDLVDCVFRPASRRRGRAPVLDSLHEQWLYALRSPDGDLAGDRRELERFAQQIRQWRRPLDLGAPFRLTFQLDEPEAGDHWNLGYYLQATEDPSLLVSTAEAWEPKGQVKKILAKGGFHPREYLLSALGQAIALYPELKPSLQSAVPEGLCLDNKGAHRFLTERAANLEEAGFGLRLPSWWTGTTTRQKLSSSAQITSPAISGPVRLSLDSLVQFDHRLALGGEPISLAELRELARLKAPLVKFRGQWIEVDAQAIQATLDFWKRRGSRDVTVRDVIQMRLGMARSEEGFAIEQVEATGWVANLLDQLDGRVPFQSLDPPAGFSGTLRPYQVRGFSWLDFLSRWGLGACLADDMGLGKTIQLLAMIQRDREEGGDRPVLLVAPTSVVGNWQREAARFTPDLRVHIHHGAERSRGADFSRVVAGSALVVTSYALLQRDSDQLQATAWRGVVLDEAQNIKNPDTKQAKAARALKADFRIALTGTPVENHLGDLWSLMEFLNPGFLGPQTAFRRDFITPIQSSGDLWATERLKRLTSPFILRRLKTDRSIIADLPEKQEMKVFCPLTKEQATLYQAVVTEAMEAIQGAEGIQRKGLVLATLMKLKQVCNHPAQFLGDRSALPGRSGKLARLGEMLEEVLAVGDRALVFSQFAEMGRLLQQHLQEAFGQEVFLLHGATEKAKRDRMVERFQTDPAAPRIFVLSVKAGGTGLNLTAANHVFHFDRWWNPAVENQATDRAFRIGQTKGVQVHKYLCQGTLEERIDEMITRKQALAEQVVGTGEDWLTKLSTSELRELFALRRDAVEV
jgi:SNF2 family DNA or RNA helicase